MWWALGGTVGAAAVALLSLHQLPGRRGRQFIVPVLVSGPSDSAGHAASESVVGLWREEGVHEPAPVPA